MVGSVAAVFACARAVIWPARPRRTAKGRRAGCPGGWEQHSGWRSGAAERVQAGAGVAESAIYSFLEEEDFESDFFDSLFFSDDDEEEEEEESLDFDSVLSAPSLPERSSSRLRRRVP